MFPEMKDSRENKTNCFPRDHALCIMIKLNATIFIMVVGLQVESNSVCNHMSPIIGQPCSGSPICLITSMITDRIG